MVAALTSQFVVALSASALFDTREGEAVFRDEGEEAFIKYQIENEDVVYGAGPAMPIAKALIAANAAIKNGPRIKLIVLSHHNPAASGRVMKSAAAHALPIKRASFVGDAPLGRLLQADQVGLFLSKNAEDVRGAIQQGFAAARVIDCTGPLDLEENQLRVAFDFDAVIASDESERVYRSQGAAAYFEHEKKFEKVPLPAGPFEPVLRWMGQLQEEVKASGSGFTVRTAIITARNEAAMNRVIMTMRQWKVRVDETHFVGTDPKDGVLQAFRPHIFFDDQVKNIASGVVPCGHVPFGIANEAPTIEPLVAQVEARVSPGLATKVPAPDEIESVTSVAKKSFETRCRAIFRSYTPLARQGSVLDERFRVFIAKNADRDGIERARILRGLQKYDLLELAQHDPTLNRELDDIVATKLEKVVEKAVAANQQTLDLR